MRMCLKGVAFCRTTSMSQRCLYLDSIDYFKALRGYKSRVLRESVNELPVAYIAWVLDQGSGIGLFY